MTDIIDIFLSPDNVARMNTIFEATREPARPCGMRAFMHEFIYGPYMAGLYDIWTGTDSDLYVRQINDEFIKYMRVIYSRKFPAKGRSRDTAPSAAIEMAAHLDPYALAHQRRDRLEISTQRWQRPDKTPDCYSRRDQSCAVHLATRDDEGSDAGCPLTYAAKFARSSQRASMPYDPTHDVGEWMHDPTAGSGDAQYHLLELDAQLSVLNDERTIPLGYGTTEDQLADDARIAARYACRTPEMGVIPKTSYKKLNRVVSASGRVTLDDDREMAHDIFSRDSKGCMLSGRR